MKRSKYPKYTHHFLDHDGTPRFYLRVPGRKRVPLQGLPWSPEFMEARDKALKADWEAPPIGASRTVAGTVNAALISYYQSSAFTSLARSTQQSRRSILERFRNDHGDKRVALMHKQALQNIVNGRKPAAQRNFMKAMRGFIDHCLSLDMIKVDALVGIKLAKMKKTGGFRTWTEEEIAQYEKRHASGTKARLALALLLQTGHARSDVVRMGRQHVKSGKLSMRRQKTNVQFDIPLLPELVAELELHSMSDQLAYLTTEYGKPFTPAGFGNWFRDRCDEAERRSVPRMDYARQLLFGTRSTEQLLQNSWRGSDGRQSQKHNATSRRRIEFGLPRAPARRSFREQELANQRTSLPKRWLSH
jgi:hypothetical protein